MLLLESSRSASGFCGTMIPFREHGLWVLWRGAKVVSLTFHAPQAAGADAYARAEWRDSCQLTGPQLELADKLTAYFAGKRIDFRAIALDLDWCTPFQRRVIEACREIPYGEVCTYADVAARAGSPRASRAVGNVMRSNRFPIVVPCHRVVRSGGGLGGFSAPTGIALKTELLQLEGLTGCALRWHPG